MPKFIYNPHYRIRDRIVFGKEVDWAQIFMKLKYFDDLTTEQLRTLMEQRFVDPNEGSNYSPTHEQYLDYLENWNQRWIHHRVTAHGYVVSPKRSDYRITVEGLQVEANGHDIPQPLIQAFRAAFENADNLGCLKKELFCWYS